MMEPTRVLLGVPGLDAIFNGDGIQPGSLILIAGPPGSGKTLLAMQLMMEMHFEGKDLLDPTGGVRLLLSGDQPKELLDRQWRKLLFTERRSRQLQVKDLRTRLAEHLPKKGKYDDLLRRGVAVRQVLKWLDDEARKRDVVAFAVDGILNLPEFHGASNEERRVGLHAIATKLRQMVRWEEADGPPKYLAAIMTAEVPTEEGGDACLLEEYLADIVLRLGVEASLPRRRRRRLEVKKSRYADAIPGQHSLWIMSEREIKRRHYAADNLGWSRTAIDEIRKGIVVFPRLRWRAETGADPLTSAVLEDAVVETVETCNFGIPGLDEMLGPSNPGVPAGTSTLIIGEPGTGKSMLCYSFLLNGLEEKQDVIFISFDQRLRSVLREAGNLRGNKSTLLEAAQAQVMAPEHPRLRFIYEHPVNLDLDQLMHLLSREIKVSRGGEGKRRSCRLIIDSLSDLERNLREPIEFNDFLITLLNKAADDQVTTLLSYESATAPGHGSSDGRALPFMADNVIRISQVEVNDASRKCVSIQKARGRNPDASIGELVFATAPPLNGKLPRGRHFRLKVKKGFEGMHNVLSGHPNSARIQMRLFAENPWEDHCNRDLVREVKRHHGKDRISYGPFTVTQMRETFWNREQGRDIQPGSDVTVVSLDQPWVRLFASSPGTQPLALWDPALADSSQKLTVSQLKPTLRRHAIPDPRELYRIGKMVAMPHYYDMGLLVVNTDKLGKLGVRAEKWPTHWEKDDAHDAGSLEDLALRLAPRLKDTPAFAFNMQEIESVNCMFIEMCWNFFATRDFLVNTADRQWNVERATAALEFLARLRHTGLLPFPCTLQDCGNALYSRIWYANLPSFRPPNKLAAPSLSNGSRMPRPVELPLQPIRFLTSARQFDASVRQRLQTSMEGEISDLEARIEQLQLGAPESSHTLGDTIDRASERTWVSYLTRRKKYLSSNSQGPLGGWSCSGAWYLGVLAAGSNANLGWSIVKEAVSPLRLERRAFDGAGLPVYQEFYLRHAKARVPWLHKTTFEDLENNFYWHVRSRTDAFGLTPDSQRQIKDLDLVGRMPEAIYALVMSILDEAKFNPVRAPVAARENITKEIEHLFDSARQAFATSEVNP